MVYQRALDRYSEIVAWPAASKTALMCALMILGVAWIGTVASLINRELTHLVDSRLLAPLMASFFGSMAVVLGLSLVVARLRREGGWTAHLYWLVALVHYIWLFFLYGTLSTPLVAIYGIGIVTLMLFFDSRVGWVAYVASIAIGLPVILFEIHGSETYAPILLERSVDAQRDSRWAAGVYFFIQSATLLALVLVQFTLSARRQLHQRLERASACISHYVPQQLAARILSGDYVQYQRPQRYKITVVFSDIEGFTDASDRMEPEEFTDLLNEYLSEMAAIADRFGGTLNQIIGDAVMIFFGAPERGEDGELARRAVRMAIAMQRRMAELQRDWFARGFEMPWQIRVGVNTGTASVGDFGSIGRMTYSAVGMQTNIAARIQSYCEPGKVLLSHSTWALVHEELPCASRGTIEVKGIHYPLQVYEVEDAAIDG